MARLIALITLSTLIGAAVGAAAALYLATTTLLEMVP